MPEAEWLVKLSRTGYDSVLYSSISQVACQNVADALNKQYQTDEYYVEEWSEETFSWPGAERQSN